MRNPQFARRFAPMVLGLLMAGACSAPASPASAPTTSAATASASVTPTVYASEERKIALAGRERSYLIYIPRSVDRKKLSPLVIYLHGAGETAAVSERDTQMNVESERQQFVIAYPQGIFNIWNAGCCNEAFAQKIDDVEFVRQIVERTKTEVPIDSERIYVAGLSAGGAMAYRIACEHRGLIAAIASVSGSLVTPECAPLADVSILQIHGTADTTSPYAGCSPTTVVCGNPLATRPAVEPMMERVRELFGCPKPTVARDGRVTITTAAPCHGATEIVLITAEGGIHAAPLGSATAGTISNADVPVLLKFFFAHRRPPART